jgi:hypothetical protein
MGTFSGRGRGAPNRGFRGRGRGRGGHFNNNNERFNNNGKYNNNFNNNNNSNNNQRRGPPQGSKPLVCFNCNQPGHIAKQCRERRPYDNYNNNNIMNRNNHYKSYTPRAHDDNDDDSDEQKKRVKFTHSYIVMSYSLSSVNDDVDPTTVYDIILDSAATEHYVCNIDMMCDVTTLTPGVQVLTANGWSTCTQTGNVKLSIDGENVMLLTNVFYMPEFTVNLLSVPRLTANGAVVNFTADDATINKKHAPVIEVPRVKNLLLTRQDDQAATDWLHQLSCRVPS